jgi:hypothetical protein
MLLLLLAAAPPGFWCVLGGWLLPAVWAVKHSAVCSAAWLVVMCVFGCAAAAGAGSAWLEQQQQQQQQHHLQQQQSVHCWSKVIAAPAHASSSSGACQAG